MSTAEALLASLPDGDVIPMPVIARQIGWDRSTQSHAITEGLIRPVAKRGAAGCYQVTRDDAVQIMMAAALAFAAGVAVIIMVRAITAAGIDAKALAGLMTGSAT
jgi:hypothetical protein